MSVNLLMARAVRNHSGGGGGGSWYEETFDTNKTTTWGTKREDSTTLTLTDYHTSGKMRANATGYNSAIQVTDSPAKAEKTIIMELDVVSANNGGGSAPNVGITLWPASSNTLSFLISLSSGGCHAYRGSSTTLPNLTTLISSVAGLTLPTSGTHTIKVEITAGTGSSLDYVVSLDTTTLLTFNYTGISSGTLITSGPYFRNVTMDLRNWKENL